MKKDIAALRPDLDSMRQALARSEIHVRRVELRSDVIAEAFIVRKRHRPEQT
jgi:hypothetical protein